MSKYQDGPWNVERVGREGNPNDPLHYAILATAFGKSVVVADTLNCSCIFSPEDQQANLTLAASAHDLLVALKIARQCIAYCRKAHKDAQSGDGMPVEVILDAAIAKAEGRARAERDTRRHPE